MVPSAMLLVDTLAAALILGTIVWWSLVVAQPDEWLLCIRNGRLVRAGIGITLWRRPGDVVVRFTSTMQRVAFSLGALTHEGLGVSLEGFVMWSVSGEGESPFRAYRKLGRVNLDAPPPDLKSPKHLLSTPQHRAFQHGKRARDVGHGCGWHHGFAFTPLGDSGLAVPPGACEQPEGVRPWLMRAAGRWSNEAVAGRNGTGEPGNGDPANRRMGNRQTGEW